MASWFHAVLAIVVAMVAYRYLRLDAPPSSSSSSAATRTTPLVGEEERIDDITTRSIVGTSGGSVRVYTAEELALHDGSHPAHASSLLLAVVGRVFDVSSGSRFYGPNAGSYSGFSGRDGSRAFVTGEFGEKGLVDDVSDFTVAQCGELSHWANFYEDSKSYHNVGVLAGRFYDVTGAATDEQRSFEACREKADMASANRDAVKQKYPSCNTRWAQATGGEVWCSDELKIPRKAAAGAAEGRKRCACYDEMQAVTLANEHDLEVYEGCDPTANKCETFKKKKK
jgi:predicted heme/steroid binding protein